MPRGETLAYLAGIVDGDGYFKVSRTYRTSRTVDPYYATTVGVSQLWPGEGVRIFAAALGGFIEDPRKISIGRWMARCEVRGSKAESAARRLLPFLQLKRNQAILLLEIGRLRPGRARVRDRGVACSEMEEVRQVLRRSHDGIDRAGKLGPSQPSFEAYQQLTPEQLGWTRKQLLSYLAGIIDSDGNLRIEKRRVKGMIGPHYRINIRCGQVLPSRAVELLAATFGGRVGLSKSRRPNQRDLATWSLHDKMAEPAIRALLPYLVVEKTEALHLLQLRRLKAEGKQGVTEWVHANRWRDSVRMRKRCYTTPRWLLSNEFAKLYWLCTRRCRGSRSDAKHESHGPVRGHPDPGGRRNRDDPRPEDPPRDTPPDRGQALRRADSHDRGGNHVGGAHRDPSQRAARERDASPGLGGEALPGS